VAICNRSQRNCESDDKQRSGVWRGFLAGLLVTITMVFQGEGTVTVAANKVLYSEVHGTNVSPEVAFSAACELFQTYRTDDNFVFN
jgi:hypothetical protein